ncbi:sugar transferase [Candidatus Peregrinibacteria bacterium]|nr:sugar transferase [Candidatus Peregrinibacteria bacterium]
MKKSEILFGILRVPSDFGAILLAFLLAYTLRPLTDLIPGVQFAFGPELLPPMGEYAAMALASGGFVLFLFAVNRMYSLKVSHGFAREFAKILFLVSTWIMFLIAYHFLVLHRLFFSRIALAHIWIFSVLFVAAGRLLISMLQSFLLRFGVGQRRLLLVGANPLADRFWEQIKGDRSYVLVGALADHQVSRKKDQVQVIGTLGQLASIVSKYHIDEIIQAEPNLREADASDLHSFCRCHHVSYRFIPDLVRLQRSNVEVEMVGDLPLVSLKETPLDGWGRVFKRLFDIVVSLLLVILLIPVWVVVPLLIKLESRGPVIYKSRRKFRNQIFNFYKFRSMVANADELKKALLAQNERSDGPMFKIKNDPRVTRLGRLLRKTSIDELPQLFNVLIGNMSLVGPRPHLPEEIERYKEHHYQVFAVKPGITGLAQVTGRSGLDFEEEVKLDVYYIENWSLWLDIKLIARSVGVVLKANGE